LWRVLRITVIAVVLAGTGVWAAGAAVELPWLRVQHIRVRGNERVHAGEAAALLEGVIGQSLLTVDLERWRAKLFASAWVADATLRRRLPGTIDVELRERVPMGIARAGTALFLVDAAGTVIDEYGPRYADCDLPIIDGILVAPVSAPPVIDRARGQLVSRLMAELRTRPDLAKQVSQIDAANVHDVHVILEGDPAVVRLGETQFVERLDSYVGLQATLREQVPDIDYVDVRYGDRVWVGLAQTAGSAPARRGDPAAGRNGDGRAQR
jgi:cell division protein FtsQ